MGKTKGETHTHTHTRTRARRGWAPAWGRHLTRQAAAPSVGGVRAHVHVWALVLGDLSLPPELGTHEAWLEHIPHQPTGQILDSICNSFPQFGAWDQLLEAAALSMLAWPSASCRRAGSQRGKGEHTLSGKDAQPLATFCALALKSAVLASPQVGPSVLILRAVPQIRCFGLMEGVDRAPSSSSRVHCRKGAALSFSPQGARFLSQRAIPGDLSLGWTLRIMNITLCFCYTGVIRDQPYLG